MKDFEDSFKNALKYALKLLGYRDRSGKEMQEKLAKKGFSEKVAEETLDFLKEKEFIDDKRLAEILKRDALERKHLGARGVRNYLLRRGIARDIADAFSGKEEDYVDAARKLVEKKMRYMKNSDEETIKRRLWGLLARRGFSSETIRDAIKFLNIKEEL
ncbi:MAG: regulatory protein RecX [Nitrospirae bacterium]|nr:regulatory protein RecX [Nitrospirota bacterium]